MGEVEKKFIARVKMQPRLVQVLKHLKYPATLDELTTKLGWEWYWVLVEIRDAGRLVERRGETYVLTPIGRSVLERLEAMERVAEL